MFKQHYLVKATGTVMFLLAVCTIQAQKRITGTVTSHDDNKPITGATVIIKGTNAGTTTASDGSFLINVTKSNAILVISYIGYQQEEVAVGNQTNVTVSLKPTTSNLNEIVVTGYTAQKKKEITGAVSIVKPSDLTKVASPSFLQQVEGRASGVTVTTSGEPGSGVSLRIRGNSTFTTGGGDPLIVVDGVQIRGAYQNSINPNDIESIQILKDAATTASYGIGANNGVIIITTKKGRVGQPKIEYNGYYGMQTAVKGYDKILIKTAKEYADLIYQSYNNAGLWPLDKKSIIARIYGIGAQPVLPQYINPLPDSADQVGFTVDPNSYNYPGNLIMPASAGTNWWDAVFRTAPITEHNLNVSGGTDKGRYFFSVNYFNQEGAMRFTDYKRYTTRANTEFKVKGFTFGENMSVAFSNGVGQPNGNQTEGNTLTEGIVKMQPIIPIYDIAGNWAGTKAGFGNGKNGVAKVYRNKDNRGESFRLLGNVFGEVRFLNHFTGRISYGVDYGINFFKAFTFVDPESNEPVGANGFREQTDRYYRWLFSQQLTYDNIFGDHTVKATAVHEAQLNNFRSINGSLSGYYLESTDLWYLNGGLADPASRTVNSFGNSDNAKESYLGRVEYGYKGRYLLNLTARYDQSSNFAADKGQLFGGVGTAWRISDENFMKGTTWINDLKLRAAYGVTGNDQIPGSVNYSSFGGGPGTTFYDINGTNTSIATGYSVTQIGKPVVWEKQRQYNVGLDAVVLQNRLELSVDVYKRENKDFLFQIQQPGTAGLFGSAIGPPYYNLGKIRNKGLEFSIAWRDKIAKDWNYGISFNMTLNKNKIVELAPQLGLTNFFSTAPESRIGPLVRHEQGLPMGTFYGYTLVGIFQSQEEVDKAPTQSGAAVGRFRWADLSGPGGKPDGIIDDYDKGAIGDPNANIVYGFNVDVSYKNFDFSMFLQGTYGNDICNYTKYFTDFYGFSGNRSNRMLYESWRPDRTNAILPKLDITDNYSYLPSSYYIENGSYLRCKVMQLGYRIPPSVLSKTGISNLRIYIQAQNLFTITKYNGLDPTLGGRPDGNGALGTEQWSSIDYGNYPNSRILSFGLNVSF